MQGGVSIGAGAGAGASFYGMISRVLSGRGAAAAGAALRAVCGAWRAGPYVLHSPHDLRATLLRVAMPLVPLLSVAHVPHGILLIDTIGTYDITRVLKLYTKRVSKLDPINKINL